VTLPLAGQSALITGGGSGIGLASARLLLRDGASVTICGRTEAKLTEAAASLSADVPEGSSASVRVAVCDVANEDDVAGAVSAARDNGSGALHIAVAAAGTGSAGPITMTTLDAWRSVMAINLDGAFLTIKHAGAAIAASGGGAIVGISSIAGPLTHRLMAAYCVSKAGLESLVRNAADELGAQGVRVNAVRPGLVPTDIAVGLTSNDAIVGDYLEQMPIRRLGTVDDSYP
jgi:NAD(P)-dependent dehydrogenase (short-subunit alcohol dehydrogenase family)